MAVVEVIEDSLPSQHPHFGRVVFIQMFSILLHFYKAAYEEQMIPHAIGLFDFFTFPRNSGVWKVHFPEDVVEFLKCPFSHRCS